MNDFDIPTYLTSLENVIIDKKLNPKLTVYKTPVGDEQKIFAIIENNSNPLQITLKCDRLLAKQLREEYETVMPAKDMSKNYWNTILCTGQLSAEYIKSLIVLSYNLVKNNLN